ncbi:MAG: M48 family metallopeptidase [Candidatus Aenigmatarchaeota archaeon]
MEKVNVFDQISRNKRNSVLLGSLVLVILLALVYSISELFAPGFALVILAFAVVFVVIDIFVSYNYGDQVVLRSVGAKPADDVRNRYIVDTVEGLAIAAGIPKPKIYVMESKEINAFACGKDPKHAAICVTTGALENLKRDELEGVIGHEMSHIRNYDIRFATLIAVLVGLAAIVSWMFLRSFRFGSLKSDDRKGGIYIIILFIVAIILAIIAPIATRIVQAAVSRRREYLADASGAELTRYPEGLANALEKIKKVNGGKMNVSEAVSHLFISDPNRSPLDSLFATHPPIDQRIKILREM